jgi:hypothetical protein
MWSWGLDSSVLKRGPVTGFCEHGNGPLGSIKYGVFRNWLSTYQLLKSDTAPWSSWSVNTYEICGNFFFKFLPPVNPILTPVECEISVSGDLHDFRKHQVWINARGLWLINWIYTTLLWTVCLFVCLFVCFPGVTTHCSCIFTAR